MSRCHQTRESVDPGEVGSLATSCAWIEPSIGSVNVDDRDAHVREEVTGDNSECAPGKPESCSQSWSVSDGALRQELRSASPAATESVTGNPTDGYLRWCSPCPPQLLDAGAGVPLPRRYYRHLRRGIGTKRAARGAPRPSSVSRQQRCSEQRVESERRHRLHDNDEHRDGEQEQDKR